MPPGAKPQTLPKPKDKAGLNLAGERRAPDISYHTAYGEFVAIFCEDNVLCKQTLHAATAAWRGAGAALMSNQAPHAG